MNKYLRLGFILTLVLITGIFFTQGKLSFLQQKPSQVLLPEPIGYMEIKELGVKIGLDEETKDLTYSYESKTDSVGFSTKLLVEKGCLSQSAAGKLSRIYKSELLDNPDYPTIFDKKILIRLVQENPPRAKEFNDFWIHFAPPQAACSDDISMGELESRIVQTIIKRIATIELIK